MRNNDFSGVLMLLMKSLARLGLKCLNVLWTVNGMCTWCYLDRQATPRWSLPTVSTAPRGPSFQPLGWFMVCDSRALVVSRVPARKEGKMPEFSNTEKEKSQTCSSVCMAVSLFKLPKANKLADYFDLPLLSRMILMHSLRLYGIIYCMIHLLLLTSLIMGLASSFEINLLMNYATY